MLLLPLLRLFVRKTRVAMLHPTPSTPQHTSLHSTEQPCCAHRTSAISLTATVFCALLLSQQERMETIRVGKTQHILFFHPCLSITAIPLATASPLPASAHSDGVGLPCRATRCVDSAARTVVLVSIRVPVGTAEQSGFVAVADCEDWAVVRQVSTEWASPAAAWMGLSAESCISLRILCWSHPCDDRLPHSGID